VFASVCVRAQEFNDIWVLELTQEVEVEQFILVYIAVLIAAYELLSNNSFLLWDDTLATAPHNDSIHGLHILERGGTISDGLDVVQPHKPHQSHPRQFSCSARTVA
jgi:hypothetical protein